MLQAACCACCGARCALELCRGAEALHRGCAAPGSQPAVQRLEPAAPHPAAAAAVSAAAADSVAAGSQTPPRIACLPACLPQEVHAYVRNWVAKNVCTDVANMLRILYGGSGAHTHTHTHTHVYVYVAFLSHGRALLLLLPLPLLLHHPACLPGCLPAVRTRSPSHLPPPPPLLLNRYAPPPPLPLPAVNEGNCSTLANLEDVDGFLVGGASLKAPSFIAICNAQNKHS